MSSGIFRAKQFKSKKNLQKLSISAPVMGSGSPTPVSSPLPPSPSGGSMSVVVLVAKYRFIATCESEMSIKENDYMKLLERPGNGWLRVQSLDRFNTCGLVPASYVDIAVNDVVNPVSLDWLYKIEDADRAEAEVERPYPKSVSITNVLRNTSNKFWYRVELTLSNNERVYVGRFYQDFYNLHIQLTKLIDIDFLPKLPLPTRRPTMHGSSSPQTTVDQRLLDELRIRCRELDDYLRRVLRDSYLQKSEAIYNFFNNLPQVCESVGEQSSATSLKEIDNQLFPGSVDIKELSQQYTFFSSTAPLPPVGGQARLPQSPSVTDVSQHNIKYSSYMKQKKDGDSKRQDEYKRYEEQKKMEEQRRFEERRMAEEQRRIEEENRIEERIRMEEQRRLEEEKRIETQRNLEKARRLEEHRKIEKQRHAEKLKRVEEEKKIEQMKREEAEKRSEDLRRMEKYTNSEKNNKKEPKMSESTSNETLSSFLSLIDRYDDPDSAQSNKRTSRDTSTGTESTEKSHTSHGSTDASDLSLEPLELDHSPENSWDGGSMHDFMKQPKSQYSSTFSQHTELASIFSKSQPSTPLGSHYQSFDERSSFGPLTPSTPIFEDTKDFATPQKEGLKRTPVTYYKSSRKNSNSFVPSDQIKIKVLLNNKEDDIIALRIKRTNLISIMYLKKLISFKIYKDYSLINHYSLQVKDLDQELSESELLDHIKSKSKVNLKLARSRR